MKKRDEEAKPKDFEGLDRIHEDDDEEEKEEEMNEKKSKMEVLNLEKDMPLKTSSSKNQDREKQKKLDINKALARMNQNMPIVEFTRSSYRKRRADPAGLNYTTEATHELYW